MTTRNWKPGVGSWRLDAGRWRARGVLECGDTSSLSPDATCRVGPKRGHVRALQRLALFCFCFCFLFSGIGAELLD